MKLLINGGCGFLGSNLASYAIEAGYDVTIFDNMSRLGTSLNKDWLETLGKFNFIHGDTRNKKLFSQNNENKFSETIKFNAITHFS